MQWRRTDAVQEVGALIAIGEAASARLLAEMRAKPASLRGLEAQWGEDWIAVFAGPVGDDAGGEAVLPRLSDVLPLYEAAPGWWLPVGMAMDLPDHLHGEAQRAMAGHHGFAPPVIVVPRMDGARAEAAEVFPLGAPLPFDQLTGGRG